MRCFCFCLRGHPDSARAEWSTWPERFSPVFHTCPNVPDPALARPAGGVGRNPAPSGEHMYLRVAVALEGSSGDRRVAWNPLSGQAQKFACGRHVGAPGVAPRVRVWWRHGQWQQTAGVPESGRSCPSSTRGSQRRRLQACRAEAYSASCVTAVESAAAVAVQLWRCVLWVLTSCGGVACWQSR